MVSAGAIRAGKGEFELVIADKIGAGLRGVERRLSMFSRKFGGAAAPAMVGAAVGVGAAGAGAVAATRFLASSIRVFAQFERQMAKVSAVTSAGRKEMMSMTKVAKDLGRTTSFTNIEVGESMVQMGRQGFTPAEINAATGDVLDLARATDTELAEATRIAGSTMRQFQLKATDMTRIVDVLTSTTNNSATTLIELGEAMKMAGTIGVDAGSTLERVSSELAVLADNGLRGTIAGTSLARVYRNLAEEGRKADFEKLTGFSPFDASGNVDLVRALGLFKDATADMSRGESLGLAQKYFGRGQVAASKIMQSIDSIGNFEFRLNHAEGTADVTAKKIEDNLVGMATRISSAFKGMQTQLGETFGPELRKVEDITKDTFNRITDYLSKNQKQLVSNIGTVFGAASLMAQAEIEPIMFQLSALKHLGGGAQGGQQSPVRELTDMIAVILSKGNPIEATKYLLKIKNAQFRSKERDRLQKIEEESAKAASIGVGPNKPTNIQNWGTALSPEELKKARRSWRGLSGLPPLSPRQAPFKPLTDKDGNVLQGPRALPRPGDDVTETELNRRVNRMFKFGDAFTSGKLIKRRAALIGPPAPPGPPGSDVGERELNDRVNRLFKFDDALMGVDAAIKDSKTFGSSQAFTNPFALRSATQNIGTQGESVDLLGKIERNTRKNNPVFGN